MHYYKRNISDLSVLLFGVATAPIHKQTSDVSVRLGDVSITITHRLPDFTSKDV